MNEWTCPTCGSKVDDPDKDGIGLCSTHGLVRRESAGKVKRQLDGKLEGKIPTVEAKGGVK